MPQVGPLEIMMVALVALIVFGPEKLPEIARTVGKALAEFRRVVDDARGEFQSGLNLDDDDDDEDERYHPVRDVLYGASSDDGSDDGERDVATGDRPDPYPAADDGRLSEQPGSLSPIPMSLDHGAPEEEPDDV
jgi:sec-independent protein translocase protein TatB